MRLDAPLSAALLGILLTSCGGTHASDAGTSLPDARGDETSDGSSEPTPGADASTSSDAAASDKDASARGDADAAAPGDAGSSATSEHWVTAYYAAYARDLMAPSEIDWSGISHIVFTRLKTQGGGTLLLDFDIDETNGPALARDVAQRAHANGKKALLMLGGENEGTGIKNSASNANRAKFVTALLKAMSDYGYDGLDLDWENDIDFDLFIALAKELRTQKPDIILTVPGGAVNGNYQTLDPKIATLVQSLDQYNLMTYYPMTAYPGEGWLSWHNTPLSGVKGTTPVAIDDSLQRHVAIGVPKAKLGMGVAFYAICYTGGVTAPGQSTQSGVDIKGGDNQLPLSTFYATIYNETYRKWDSTPKVPYLTLPSAPASGPAAGCRYFSFDDEESLEAKGAFMRAQGYGGTIIWTINQGLLKNSSKSPTALTQALKRGFLDP